jgi:tetratricopeptide (TPR) repeat protein
MKSHVVLVVSLLLFPAAALAQHNLAMHNHSGANGSSACQAGRFDGPIKLYKAEEIGHLKHKVNTNRPEAQDFFNQGLTFFYGFDSESAMRSFHQATKIDPDLAMAFWGVALAAGGDLNIPADDPCVKLARAQIQRAQALSGRAFPAEGLDIDARARGLGPDGSPRVYAAAMKSVYTSLGPKDSDAVALYAYSLMSIDPWRWWTSSGKPTPEISEALTALEAGLKENKEHLGLNHMKIHAMEEAPIAQTSQAKPSADLLFGQAPVATPHLRHMPAHIYLLQGLWDLVVEANKKAVLADQAWLGGCQGDIEKPSCNQLLVGHYYSHDLLFLAVGRANHGEWDQVGPLANALEDNVVRFLKDQPGLEHYLTTGVMMRVDFGRWQELVDLRPPEPLPDPRSPSFCSHLRLKLATAVWYFGHAMGDASQGKPTDADVYGFEKAQGCVSQADAGWGNNKAKDILRVVHERMMERIYQKKGDREAAKRSAARAVEAEDALVYDEPPGWYLSSRVNYGAALYAAGTKEDLSKAVEVFQEDQRRRPGNSRSLFGLWQTCLKLHKQPEADHYKALFEKQWKLGAPLPRMEDL